jgi:glycogen debranching enzyme
MGSPRLANGSLLGLLANQRRDGRIPGAVNVNSVEEYIYHANWGRCALEVYYVDHDRRFLELVYEPLKRYAQWLMIDRDRENSQVYDVVDQGETGQEYNGRYLEADPDADDWRKIHLKGVDATVYAYDLFCALAKIARLLDQPLEAGRWDREAELTRNAVRSLMWDPQQKMFFDVNPAGLRRCSTKGPVCFYPFMTDIATSEHLGAIREHLLNPKEFWTEFPVPTVSLDDPYFDPEAQWKRKRMSCPWSGRVWPMTNSHIVDALAHAARTLDDSLRPEAAHLLRRFIQMMFFEMDPRRPNCFEHYNPFTGRPCEYRGVDDYQHSWVVDLIIKHVCGLVPQECDALVVDPFPFDLGHFTLDNVFYKGHRVRIVWRTEKIDDEEVGFSVYVDGALKTRETQLTRVEIDL